MKFPAMSHQEVAQEKTLDVESASTVEATSQSEGGGRQRAVGSTFIQSWILKFKLDKLS